MSSSIEVPVVVVSIPSGFGGVADTLGFLAKTCDLARSLGSKKLLVDFFVGVVGGVLEVAAKLSIQHLLQT
jgi:hypothetical protein